MNAATPLSSFRPSAPPRTRILIIDDDDLMLSTTRRPLARAGFDVRTRSQALGTSEEVLDFQPHYVLLDVRMPALDGGHLGELLCKRFGDRVGVILHSAMDEVSLQGLASRIGAVGYIHKGSATPILEQLEAVMTAHPRNA